MLKTNQKERDTVADKFARKPAGVMFPRMVETIREGHCTDCGENLVGFNDILSKREWEISGMCQECQNQTFVEDSTTW